MDVVRRRGQQRPFQPAPFAGLGALSSTPDDGGGGGGGGGGARRDLVTWGRLGHLSEGQVAALAALDARAPPELFPPEDPLLARYAGAASQQQRVSSSQNPAGRWPAAGGERAESPVAPPSNPPPLQPQRDMFLLRLLRARDFDVGAAEALLRSILAWRRENRPWTISREEAERPEASFHIYNTGARDERARPVLYALQRSMKRAVMDVEAFRRATIGFIESVVMNMPPDQDQFVLIYDFDGFSVLRHTSLAAAQAMFQIVQESYPDSLGAAYALPNYPISFYTVFQLARPFIGPQTAAKIYFLSAATYKEDLAQNIGKDALPIWLGGTLTSFSFPQSGR